MQAGSGICVNQEKFHVFDIKDRSYDKNFEVIT